MGLSEITRDAVLEAIGEYDRLGQDGFLERYGFDRARQYLLVHDGKRYDSKAIVGAAHGFLPEERPLTAGEFSGGEATVGRLLRRLGFTVQVGDALTADGLVRLLSKLQVYRRDGRPALYQPITLLWAFGRAFDDEPRLVSWAETTLQVSDPGGSPVEASFTALSAAYKHLCTRADMFWQNRDTARAERTTFAPIRSEAARRAVLIRSRGRCENPRCAGDIQDLTTRGEPILEIDHVHDLALGGPDHPAQMIALCPNCHAIKTRGRTREELRPVLLEAARNHHLALLRGYGDQLRPRVQEAVGRLVWWICALDCRSHHLR
jgi:HNH endonuclease